MCLQICCNFPNDVLLKIVISGVFVRLTDRCNAIVYNVPAALRGSGFHTLSYELPACKSSKYFQTKVVPPSRKTAR
jgi:hypothetical protein